MSSCRGWWMCSISGCVTVTGLRGVGIIPVLVLWGVIRGRLSVCLWLVRRVVRFWLRWVVRLRLRLVVWLRLRWIVWLGAWLWVLKVIRLLWVWLVSWRMVGFMNRFVLGWRWCLIRIVRLRFRIRFWVLLGVRLVDRLLIFRFGIGLRVGFRIRTRIDRG